MSLLNWYAAVVRTYAPRPRRPYEYLVNRYYAHRVDPVLTWLADRAGFSPNAVTLMSLASGLAAVGTMLNGSYPVAAVFIQLHHLLDGVDGNLARTYDRRTDFGKRLDIYSDQAVNLAVFVSLAYVADVPAWLAMSMLATLYIDLLLVHLFITPFSRHHALIRDRWKQWFMDRGLMPAFDIFTIYLIVSACLLFETPETAVVLVTITKTLDWLYRLYECARTWARTRQTNLEG
jgi:phosphatidylglycerophosphate synthase